ncbi:(3R)-3-hydroxyacyl-CoA dehydrogenase-like [Styela clava]
MEETDFDDVIRGNLKGTFMMCKQFLLSLEKFNTNCNDTRATEVNISSGTVIKCVAKVSDYIASKFGVVGITKTLAVEYGKHEVRCNAVLPGLTTTPLLTTFTRDFLQAIEEGIPMKRLAKADKIAKCILSWHSTRVRT